MSKFIYIIYIMSLYFNGYDHPPSSRSHLEVPANSPGFNLGYNDFTIEWWQLLDRDYIQPNDYPHVFMSGYRQGNTNLGVSFENQSLIYWENSYEDSNIYIFPLPSENIVGQWVHFSINRIRYYYNATSTTRIFVNGQLLGNVETLENINFNNYPLFIGNQTENLNSRYAFKGYITSFLILNGKCLHEIPFTPPLQPYYPDKYTVLLLLGTENGSIVDNGINKADFYGSAAPFVNSPLVSVSSVDHKNDLPPGFNPSIPVPPVDPNIAIARIKKSPLFSGQNYSAFLRRLNTNTTKIEVPMSWANGYYIKNETENNSRNAALRRVRAGGANVPKKVTKVSTNQQIFSN
jgi:Concanavalin A-like lectin/glucanases superfamily